MRHVLPLSLVLLILGCSHPTSVPAVPAPTALIQAAPTTVQSELVKEVSAFGKILKADKTEVAVDMGAPFHLNFELVPQPNGGTRILSSFWYGVNPAPLNGEAVSKVRLMLSNVKDRLEKPVSSN